MTFQPAAFVDGGPINGVLLRRQYQSTSGGGEGVAEAGDLLVRPLDVPAAGFIIGDGAAAIRGRSTAWDGSYYALNIGDHTVSDVTGTGSGGGRSDMVVAKVSTGAVIEPYIIQGVPTTARTIAETAEPNLSAIPLARIDWPASTGTITQSMLADLRQMLQPRTERVLRVAHGAPLVNGDYDKAGDYTTDFERWPQHDWPVTIPEWATQAQLIGNWDQVFYEAPGNTGGTHDARGQLRVGLVGSEFVTTVSSAYNINATTATNGYRTNMANRAQVAVPEALRGQTVQVRMYAKGDEGRQGRLVADELANFSVDIQFNEVASPEAAL